MTRSIFLPFVLALFILAGGCATTMPGRGLSPEKSRALATGLKGKDKDSIIQCLGGPDFITADQGAEYWGYHRQGGWHVNFYYGSVGRNEARDLVIKLQDGHAADAFVVGKGSSLGIIQSPLSARG
jgi:hypothetical protein